MFVCYREVEDGTGAVWLYLVEAAQIDLLYDDGDMLAILRSGFPTSWELADPMLRPMPPLSASASLLSAPLAWAHSYSPSGELLLH